METIREYLLGPIMEGIYIFLDKLGVNNAALCIILFTILVKTLMLPLTLKQQRFSKVSAVMNPEIQKVQAKYKGKTDRESLDKQQREMQVIYDKYGTSPTAGCLPMLITLPIMFALYGIIQDVAKYVSPIGDIYDNIAKVIENAKINDKIEGFANSYKIQNFDAKDGISNSEIVSVLKKLTREDWKELTNAVPEIASDADKITTINKFVGGLNVAETPMNVIKNLWYAGLIPIVSMLLQIYQTKQINDMNNTSKDKKKKDENAAMQSVQTVTKVMPIVSGVICFTLPIGLGLYWIMGSVYQIVQQFFINRYFEKTDIEDIIKKNVEKTRNKKKSSMSERLREKLAEAQDEQEQQKAGKSEEKTLKDYAYVNVKSADDNSKDKATKNEKKNKETVKKGSTSNEVDKKEEAEEVSKYEKGSISSYANIMNTEK